ncbi:MAG TPA: murein L,D-transpeptidase catalytic domain family protein [Longimicrobiaceae bacterium]
MLRSRLLTIATAATCAGLGGALLSESGHATFAEAAQARRAQAVAAPAPATPVLQASRAVLASAGIEGATQAEDVSQVDVALRELAGKVKKQSDPEALKMAFKAYFAYKAEHPEKVRKPYLYYVDYGLSATTPRGYVFDMKALKVVDGPFMVAHGRGSAPPSAGIPTRFGNRMGAATTSLGLYLAQETYAFVGHTGGKAYRSVGLRLAGLSGKFNGAARARGVVAHGAPYVTASKAGRSEGCPAIEPARAQRLLPRLSNGSLVFLFSPRDHAWLEQDPWANGDGNG